MKTSDEDNVVLSKVKLINGGGIEVHYREIMRDGDLTWKEDYIKKSTVNPHPELTEKLNELKEYLLRCYNVNSIDVLRKNTPLEADEKKAFKVLKKLIDNQVKENMQKTTISGIAISGEIGKHAVIITGKQLQANKSKTALNSPRIKLNQTTFGFESDIETIIYQLDTFVKAYLFDGRKAQLDMFDDVKGVAETEPAEEAA